MSSLRSGRVVIVAFVAIIASTAHADEPPAPGQKSPETSSEPAVAAPAPTKPEPPKLPAPALPAPAVTPIPIAGFRARGDTKVHDRMVGRLTHLEIGDLITPDKIPELEAALLSSELFRTASVTFEDAPDGVLVVAMLKDKMSWIAAPTVYVLPSSWSVGVGYAENNLLGEEKKLLLYGQIGNRTNLFFGTYLDPAVNGTKLQLRFDIYAYRRYVQEYLNPPSDPRSFEVGRETQQTFLDGGVLVGWRFYWWLVADFRLRGAYVFFRDAKAADGSPLPVPQTDGWDITTQERITLDARKHLYGVTWGPYVQALVEPSVPGLDSYGYVVAAARAYYSWRLFGEHELELRTGLGIGRHLPFHEELAIGGVSDLRGYDVDQFRGDTRASFRVEYSVPIVKWKIFAFRALGFFDSGYVAYHFQDPSGARNYLPTEVNGAHWFRNDFGGGLRIYVNNVVLPLLGLDYGYGLEGHSRELYFEIGLTDF
ncbi:MAG: family outer membrane protein [Myxococcales bacterium]|nr:family outer membrane protein [Myxococcales bacterium]